MTPKGQIIKGFKATDKDMKCRGFQFELGVWYEHDGDIELCASGFHFCEYPSGTWAYYDQQDCRRFEIEAEEVVLSNESGADRKHVSKRIRLVNEIFSDGDRNTGDRNTGGWNTGNGNTGNGNTGGWNTGGWNTGNRNTGDRNTGGWNTGNGNTGNGNTGGWNTGDGNTGDGNTGNFHSGSLCFGEAPFFLFNKKCKRDDVDFCLVKNLSERLTRDDYIDPTPFLSLPNATKTAIKKLHEAHIAARKSIKGE